ncbi:hypothetical protein GQ600_20712 [Phytophthora cactorum]|nr:hypothetical protein GQ600_20712 [Phytophthora cactorum]
MATKRKKAEATA